MKGLLGAKHVISSLRIFLTITPWEVLSTTLTPREIEAYSHIARWMAAGLWAPVDAWPWGDRTSKGPSRLWCWAREEWDREMAGTITHEALNCGARSRWLLLRDQRAKFLTRWLPPDYCEREKPGQSFLEPNYRAVQPAPHHSEAGFWGLLVCSPFHPCPSPGQCPGSGRQVIRSQPDHAWPWAAVDVFGGRGIMAYLWDA